MLGAAMVDTVLPNAPLASYISWDTSRIVANPFMVAVLLTVARDSECLF